MQLTLSLPLLFCSLSLAIFPSIDARVVSERRSTFLSLEDCPTGRLSVANKQVFSSADGKTLTATNYFCAEADTDASSITSEALKRSEFGFPFGLAARQNQNPQICNQTCVQSCHVIGTPSNVLNCTDLINIVNNLDGQTFLVPPSTISIFEAGQCSTRFFHNQAQAVDVCFSWLSGLLPTMNACFATPPQNAAECNQANVDFAFDLTLIFPGALN